MLALLECLNTCTHSRESIVAAARAAASREDITQVRVSARARARVRARVRVRVRVRVRPHPSQAGIAQALVSAGCEGSEGGSDEAREAVFAEALAAYGTYEEQLAGAIEQQEQLVEALRIAF